MKFGAVLEPYHKLQQKLKTPPEFKNALKSIWSAVPEKAIDNSTGSAPLQLSALCQLPALPYSSYATDLKAPNQRASDTRHRIDATRQQINRRTCSCDAETIHFPLHSYTIYRSAASA